MKTNRSLLMAAICTAVFASSCAKKVEEKKEEIEDSTTSLSLASANSTSQYLYDDTHTEILISASDNFLMYSPTEGDKKIAPNGVSEATGTMGCVGVTVEPQGQAFPKTVTLDFGTGCTSATNNLRKGKIVYTISDRFRNPGAVINVTFQNYSVNGYGLEGTYSLTNASTSATLVLASKTVDGKITYPTGQSYTWNGDRSLTQTAGATTPFNFTDDEFSMTGKSSVKNSSGDLLEAQIATALLIKNSCRNAVSGTVNLKYKQLSGVLDYGTGDCDNMATLKVSGISYPITLP